MALERGSKVIVKDGTGYAEGILEGKASSAGTAGTIYKVKFDNDNSGWFPANEVFAVQ